MLHFPAPLRAAACAGLLALAPTWAGAQAYPLCPGATWTGAGPLLATAASARPASAAAASAPASLPRSLREMPAHDPLPAGPRAMSGLDVLATAGAARKNLDPRVYSAYFGDSPEALTPSELARKSADPSVMRLPGQLKGLLDVDDPRGMVAPGSGTRPGGLDGVPQGVPVAFGVDAAGNACVRPATDADWKLDSHTKQISRVWDPKGFRDVGMLVTFDPKAATPYSFCTLTRIAKGFAVTAAHCVVDSKPGEAIALHDFAASTLRSLVLTPRLDGTPPDIGRCFDHPQTCGYYVSAPQGRALLRQGTQWAAGALGPAPDVALLAVAFDAGAPPPTTGVSARAAPGRLTIAGYGHTDATKVNTWGDLLVGWQQSTASIDEKELVWSVDVADGHAGACQGDSGGPVYQGDFAGLAGEAKRLGGIVSSGVPAAGDALDADQCTHTGTNSAARLDTELAWICPAARGTIAGCPAVP